MDSVATAMNGELQDIRENRTVSQSGAATRRKMFGKRSTVSTDENFPIPEISRPADLAMKTH